MPPEESLLARVAPSGVSWAELDDTGPSPALHPGEAALVAAAADKRRRDFAAGRWCARAALARMGLEGIAILRGDNGAPLWPANMVGSITHTKGYAAALVADNSRFLGIGVDAERVGGVTDRLMPSLFDAAEQAWLAGLPEDRRCVLATVFFSAKEAHFKAYSAPTPKPLLFKALHVDLEGEGFTVTQPGEGPIRGLYAVSGDLVVTSVCLPNPGIATG